MGENGKGNKDIFDNQSHKWYIIINTGLILVKKFKMKGRIL